MSWWVARRYLAPRKRGRLLSFITWIALGGVTVGVTALIVVLGVMNGMQEELRGKILSSTPHILVLEPGRDLRMDDWRPLADSVRQLPEVQAVSPFMLTKVALLLGGADARYAQTAELYGVSIEMDPADVPTEMEREIIQRVRDLEEMDGDLPGIILGSRLANRLVVFPSDTMLVIGFENVRMNPFGYPQPVSRLFEVTGTFTTGMHDYDLNNAYASLETVQELLGVREADQVSGLNVRIRDPWEADAVGREIREHLGPPYHVETWIMQNQALFSALELEKIALGVILFLIVIVAAFNIVSTLVMVVVDRTSEIGILKSMGMSDAQVLRVFVLQGLAIGVLGTVLGGSLGLLLSWILHRYEIIEIPAEVYFIDRLPVATDPFDVALVIGGSLMIALLATIYPALQASRLQPVEAIRHD